MTDITFQVTPEHIRALNFVKQRLIEQVEKVTHFIETSENPTTDFIEWNYHQREDSPYVCDLIRETTCKETKYNLTGWISKRINGRFSVEHWLRLEHGIDTKLWDEVPSLFLQVQQYRVDWVESMIVELKEVMNQQYQTTSN